MRYIMISTYNNITERYIKHNSRSDQSSHFHFYRITELFYLLNWILQNRNFRNGQEQ